MNGPRPRGRAVALAMVVLAAVVTAQALLQGSLIPKAYARPLEVAPRHGTASPMHRHHGPMPAWEAFSPGAFNPVVAAGRHSVAVPILMYHYIRVPPDPALDRLGWGLSTSPADFATQMDYLDSQGFHTITLTELRDYLTGLHSLPAKPVVLTFDDGYADVYTQAFPVLKQHHFTAVAYIVSGFVGWAGWNVMPDQVREMDAYGIEIGAHTVNHVDLTKAGGSLTNEVAGSKAALEALVGHPVLDFCYPSGRFDPAVIQAVVAAGFASATTTQTGTVHSYEDRYSWTRVRVSGSESLADFAAPLQVSEIGARPTRVNPIQIVRADPLVYQPDAVNPEVAPAPFLPHARR